MSTPPERELRIMVVTDQYEPMVGGVPTVTRDLAPVIRANAPPTASATRSSSSSGTIPRMS